MGMAILAGAGTTIQRNTIDSTGYIPIRFGGSNVLINENVIRYFCLTIDDGGGIYTWSDGKTEPENRKVTNNLVLYGIGASAGTNKTPRPPAEGIYVDDRSPNVEVKGNTVAYCSNNGIYVHNARKCPVKNNTVFGCSFALKIVHDNLAPTFPVVDCDIQNNILASSSLDVTKTLLTFQTRDTTTLAKLGIMDHNIYCHPFQKEGYIRYIYNPLVTKKSLSLNLEEWRSVSGYDKNAKLSPRSFSLIEKILSPNLITNSFFSMNTHTWSTWDPVGNTSSLEWVPDQLDGGCLSFKVSSNGTVPSRIQTLIPPITNGKDYLLKMSVKTSKEGLLNTFFIQNIAPYPFGSKNYTVTSGTERKDIELPIRATMTQEKPSLFVNIGPEDGTVLLDNIELYEVMLVNPDNRVRFEFNTTSENRFITADQYKWFDKGKHYSN